jgi:hypothetical protein
MIVKLVEGDLQERIEVRNSPWVMIGNHVIMIGNNVIMVMTVQYLNAVELRIAALSGHILACDANHVRGRGYQR